MRTYLLALVFGSLLSHTCYGMDEQHQPFSSITTITSFDEAAKVLDAADDNTLVLFDVDDTLTTLKNRPSRKLDMEDQSVVLTHEEILVIEPTIIERISSLQQKARVLALTAINTRSPMGYIDDPLDWRHTRLNECNIDFSSRHFTDDIYIKDEDCFERDPITLYNGILATGDNSKGDTVSAFLYYCKKYKDWKPSHVIFFDDRDEHINDVAEVLTERGINFTGFIYNGLRNTMFYQNDEAALLQIKYFRITRTWLSIEQACKIVQENEHYKRMKQEEQDTQLTGSNNATPQETTSSSHDTEQTKQDEQETQSAANNNTTLPQSENVPRQTVTSNWRLILSKWCSCKGSAAIEPTPSSVNDYD